MREPLQLEVVLPLRCQTLLLQMVCEALVVRVDRFKEADLYHVLGTEGLETSRVLHLLQRLGDVLFQDLAVALLQELNEAGKLEKMPNILYNVF